jgi:hypothetical protein
MPPKIGSKRPVNAPFVPPTSRVNVTGNDQVSSQNTEPFSVFTEADNMQQVIAADSVLLVSNAIVSNIPLLSANAAFSAEVISNNQLHSSSGSTAYVPPSTTPLRSSATSTTSNTLFSITNVSSGGASSGSASSGRKVVNAPVSRRSRKRYDADDDDDDDNGDDDNDDDDADDEDQDEEDLFAQRIVGDSQEDFQDFFDACEDIDVADTSGRRPSILKPSVEDGNVNYAQFRALYPAIPTAELTTLEIDRVRINNNCFHLLHEHFVFVGVPSYVQSKFA